MAVKMVTEDNDIITDKNTLANIDYFTNGGFSLRAVVVPISIGKVMIWGEPPQALPTGSRERQRTGASLGMRLTLLPLM